MAHTTSPFLESSSIQNALEKVLNPSLNYDSAFSVSKHSTFAWYNHKPINYDLKYIPRTQDIESVYIETSGFYIFTRDLWVEHHQRIGFSPYLQTLSPIESIDIDTKEDFEFASLLAKGKNINA